MFELACNWRIDGEPGGGDVVGASLSRHYATLRYWSHCLACSGPHDAAGGLLLDDMAHVVRLEMESR